MGKVVIGSLVLAFVALANTITASSIPTGRRLLQTSISVSGSTSSPGSPPVTYDYTKSSVGADGQPVVTKCSFVDGIGGCQVDGVPVPVQQYSGSLPILPGAPAPAPEVGTWAQSMAVQGSPMAGPSLEATAQAAAAISSQTATSTGQTACVFVNGVGGCQTSTNPTAPPSGPVDASSVTAASSSTATSQGGTACTMVNGVGGCQTTG